VVHFVEIDYGHCLHPVRRHAPQEIGDGQVIAQPFALTAGVEQVLFAFDPTGPDWRVRPLGRAAVLADTLAFAVSPIPDRYTVTKPVVIGLLAFLNRYIGFGCNGLESVRSPLFIAFVTV
jgi:hypothetical protein